MPMRSPTGQSLAALRRLKLRRVGDNPPYLRITRLVASRLRRSDILRPKEIK
jgi:hypothetical protein